MMLIRHVQDDHYDICFQKYIGMPLGCIPVSEISPNSCLQHGVLALHLLIHWGMPILPRADDPHFCHTSLLIFTFSNHRFSECCSSPRQSAKSLVRHPCSDPGVAHFCHTSLLIFTFLKCAIALRPLLSSTFFKKHQ